MIQISTLKSSLILAATLMLSGFGFAQTAHEVEVSSNDFTPQSINIQVGDTVRWTNVQGNHNVNGNQSVFASNPESFGNAVGGPGWVYEFVFTIPGTYDYQCDPHAGFGMVGDVTVETVTNISETAELSKEVKVYPTPTNATAWIEVDQEWTQTASFVSVFDLTGNKVYETQVTEQRIGIDVSKWAPAVYLVQVNNEVANTETKRLIVQ